MKWTDSQLSNPASVYGVNNILHKWRICIKQTDMKNLRMNIPLKSEALMINGCAAPCSATLLDFTGARDLASGTRGWIVKPPWGRESGSEEDTSSITSRRRASVRLRSRATEDTCVEIIRYCCCCCCATFLFITHLHSVHTRNSLHYQILMK